MRYSANLACLEIPDELSCQYGGPLHKLRVGQENIFCLLTEGEFTMGETRIFTGTAEVLLSQREIAERSGRSPATIHYIINGDREPSKKMAEDLERATCVSRFAWVWPEYVYNPYIPFEDTPVDGRLWVEPEINLELWQRLREEAVERYIGGGAE